MKVARSHGINELAQTVGVAVAAVVAIFAESRDSGMGAVPPLGPGVWSGWHQRPSPDPTAVCPARPRHGASPMPCSGHGSWLSWPRSWPLGCWRCAYRRREDPWQSHTPGKDEKELNKRKLK